MTELKADSQSIRTVQTQPSAKKRSTKPTQPSESAATGEAESESEEAAPKRKRRTTTPKATPEKAKQPAKATKQVSSAQIKMGSKSSQSKLSWEPSHSTIAARFAQLEQELQHYKNEVSSILSEMDQLKELSQQFNHQNSQESRRTSGLTLPMEASPKVQEPDLPMQPRVNSASTNPAIASSVPVNPGSAKPIPPISETDKLQPPQVSQAASNQVRRQTGSPDRVPTRSRPKRSRHRFNWKGLSASLLKLPDESSRVAIDAVLWVLAAAGLRYGLKQLVIWLPIFSIPISILIFVPVLAAVYLALCVPKTNHVLIYRLLLITLGLFVGGRL